jgi:hypothetical protein
MVPASVSDKFDMPNESKNFDYNFIQFGSNILGFFEELVWWRCSLVP